MTRRSFLRKASTTPIALGVALAAGARGAAAGDRRFTIDLVCGNIGKTPPLDEALSLARRHGFESVGPIASQLVALPASGRGEVRARLKEAGLTWGAAPLEVDFRGEDATFRDGLKALPAAAAALNEVGATRVGTWISPAHRELTYLANFKRHADRLREVATILGDHGLRFGLEYVGPKTSWTSGRYPFVHTMAEARELIDAIGRPGVGLVLDSWHWYCAGESVDDLRTLSNRDVVACDLNDAPAGIPVDQQKDLVRELPAATGVIDLKGFLNALVEIGYDGPVRAEPFSAALRQLPLEEAVARTAAAMSAALERAGLGPRAS